MTNTTDTAYVPPFSVNDVYILPFKEKKVYRPDGTFYYEPLTPKHKTTGIPLMDDFCQWLSGGGLGYDRTMFYLRNGLNVIHNIYRKGFDRLPDVPSNNDFAGMVRILFGMEVTEFQTAYCLRTAKLLLVYSDLPIDEVAKRASLICSANMARVFRRNGLPPPKTFRIRRRKEFDITDTTMYKL